MKFFKGGGSENPEENWNLSDKARLTPRKRGNAAFAVWSKPSFVTAASVARAVVIHGFQHRRLWLFACTHAHFLKSGNSVRMCYSTMWKVPSEECSMGVFCGVDVFLILKTVTYECPKLHVILPLTKKNASHKLCDSTFCCSRDKKTVLQLALN